MSTLRERKKRKEREKGGHRQKNGLLINNIICIYTQNSCGSLAIEILGL
jgi:hypothetical protein